MTECPNCKTKIRPGDPECHHCGTDITYIKKKQVEKEAQADKVKREAERVELRLDELIKSMSESQRAELLDLAEELHGRKKRAVDRFPCMITADCVYRTRAFNDFVRDISTGGVFIETGESLTEGEDILMTLSFSHHARPFRISGQVVRKTQKGVGVQFKTVSQVQGEMLGDIVKKVEKFGR